MKFSTEIVNGQCPTCDEITMLVGLSNELLFTIAPPVTATNGIEVVITT